MRLSGRSGLYGSSLEDSTSRFPGHGQLSCRVILLGCLGYVSALETARPADGGQQPVAQIDTIGDSAREAPPLRTKMEAFLRILQAHIFGEPI